jgi:hypothetical protein
LLTRKFWLVQISRFRLVADQQVPVGCRSAGSGWLQMSRFRLVHISRFRLVADKKVPAGA